MEVLYLHVKVLSPRVGLLFAYSNNKILASFSTLRPSDLTVSLTCFLLFRDTMFTTSWWSRTDDLTWGGITYSIIYQTFSSYTNMKNWTLLHNKLALVSKLSHTIVFCDSSLFLMWLHCNILNRKSVWSKLYSIQWIYCFRELTHRCFIFIL